MNEQPNKPHREPSFRKLSQHLLHVITPPGAEKSLNLRDIQMDVFLKESILEDQTAFQRTEKVDLE